MPLTNFKNSEEASPYSHAERVALAKFWIQNLENDFRTDAEIKIDLDGRLEALLSGKDKGLSLHGGFGGSSLHPKS